MERRIKKTEAVLSRLSTISRENNIPVCIVILQHHSFGQKKSEQVMKLIHNYGLHGVSTREAFRGTRLSDFFIYKADHHPNADANVIFADVIYDYLKGTVLSQT